MSKSHVKAASSGDHYYVSRCRESDHPNCILLEQYWKDDPTSGPPVWDMHISADAVPNIIEALNHELRELSVIGR